jgi:hypothetical protein
MRNSLNGKKNEQRYECKICDFVCCYKSNYDIHLSTRKHITTVKIEELSKETTHTVISSQVDTSTAENINTCNYCNKRYAHLSGLSRHKKMCITPNQVNNEDSVTTLDDTTPINEIIRKNTNNLEKNNDNTNHDLIAENQEMKTMVMTMMSLVTSNTQLQSQMLEIMKASTNPTVSGIASNVSGHHNATHNNNSTFNMNLFLNEKCKDAMNMKDFLNSIQLNMTDVENVGRLGYVEGMSNIFIDNLQKTELCKRPVHCSDLKRETLYVKENNQWERDGPDHAKMTNAVLAVEHKNVVLVNEWAKANPRCLNSNTRENEKYFKLSKAVTDGEKEGNIDKVIRKVAKRVTIEKDTLQIE